MLLVLAGVVFKILTYSLVLVAAVWVWFQWSYRHVIRAAANLPCPLPRLPILGHLHYTFSGLVNFTTYALKLSIDGMNQGMYTICFWCGPLPLILVHGVEDVKKVLTSSNTAEKGDEMRYLDFAIGYGLLTAPGYVWKISRRHLSPLFHPRNLEHMVPSINRNSRKMVSRLSDHVGREPVDVFQDSVTCTFETACHFIFGAEEEFDVKSKGFLAMLTFVERLTVLFMKRMVLPWMRLDSIFEIFYKKELDEINEIWEKFTEEPLKTSKAKYAMKRSKESFISEDQDKVLEDEGPLTLIDVFSVLQKKFPQFGEAQLKAELITFLATGMDSVGLAHSSCLLALAQYQDIQERLYQEIMAVVGPERDVETADLNNMPYLDQVFKETVRWFCIIPYIIRKPAEDLKLSSCTIPAGNTVVVCLWGVLMDEKNYSNPQKFDPERFTSENMAKRDKFTYLPFSGGSRNCIGRTYAYSLVKTMLVHTLRRYKLSTDVNIHTMKRKAAINLMSADGYYVKLENRS